MIYLTISSVDQRVRSAINEILEKEEVKKNCKNLAKPFIEMILYEAMPYIYFITFFFKKI